MPPSWASSLVALLVSCAVCNGATAAGDSRLRIVNGCDREPLWVAHEAGQGVGPDPQNVKIEPLGSYDFQTPGGLSGTRYWPKMRCDERGNVCGIGESGGPQEVCGTKAGCAPPVDTKFEATFGHEGEEDWVDISLVDGYTLPFRFEMLGNCSAGFGSHRDGGSVVDCSHLSFEDCPGDEDLGDGRTGVSLQVVNPDTNKVVGCYSPCSKLTLAQWGNAVEVDQKVTAPYCCPTPPESPEDCRAGPVGATRFVRAVHRMCPGVYGYSYDDGMGLVRCPSHTRYEVTFYCPAVLDAPPGWRPPSQPRSPPALVPAPLPAPLPAPRRVPLPVPALAQAAGPEPAEPPAPEERLTWVRVLGLPAQEGETMRLAGSQGHAARADDVRRICAAQALCVGFSFRPDTGEWYLKKVGTGFDGRTASWKRYKWGHEEWQFHYIRERASSGPIRWAAHPGMCLGVAAASASSGRVHLEACTEGADPQQFLLDSFGSVHWAANPELCLDVVGRLPINGNRLQLAVCRGGDGFQAFELPSSGSGKLKWKKYDNMCLDVTDGKVLSGSPIQIWECVDGNGSQEFSMAFASSDAGDVRGVGPQQQAPRSGRLIRLAARPSLCLAADVGEGAHLRLEGCDALSVQKQEFTWDGAEGKIHLAERPDLCVYISDRDPHVHLSGCGMPNTKLEFGSLESRAGGKVRWAAFPSFCLDAEEGQDIQMRVCEAGSDHQDFTVHEGVEPPQAAPVGTDLLATAAVSVDSHSPWLAQPRGRGAGHESTSASRRLLIRNGCDDEQMWIGRRGAEASSNPEVVLLQPQESRSFATPSGSSGTTFWPMLGCDANGHSCRVGEHVAGTGGCGLQGCSPVDTSFEAIFGTNGGDLAFVSLERGYTLPFTLDVKGECQTGSRTVHDHKIDCSGLMLERCPVAEDLGSAGSDVDLRQWSARHEAVGCMSPCSRVKHIHSPEEESFVREFCCSAADSDHSCRAGSTDYVAAVHQMCPDVASFASDRGLGVLRCQDTTQYELTFYCSRTQRDSDDQLVEMLVSKASQQSSAVAWRWRCWWLAGIAGAITAGAALVVAARAGRSGWRRRTYESWQPLATSPGV